MTWGPGHPTGSEELCGVSHLRVSPCGDPARGPQGAPWWCHIASAATPVGVQHPRVQAEAHRALVFTEPHRGGGPGCRARGRGLSGRTGPSAWPAGLPSAAIGLRGSELGTGGPGEREAGQAHYPLGASVSARVSWSGNIRVGGAAENPPPGPPSSRPRWFSASAAPRDPGDLRCGLVPRQFRQQWFPPGLRCPQGTCGSGSGHLGTPEGGSSPEARAAPPPRAGHPQGGVVWPPFPGAEVENFPDGRGKYA